MFVWVFSSRSRIFNRILWRRHHCRWRAAIFFTYARHSWPLSSEGSLVCHTYCDKGHPFIMVIFEDLWLSHLLQSVWQWSCHYLFIRLMSIASGIRTPNLPLTRRFLLPTAVPSRSYILKKLLTKAQFNSISEDRILLLFQMSENFLCKWLYVG